ncbi:MAG: membrane protein insertase YidC [Halobacteriovoraceae bacterium]|nr:membrane protein insertase YidC [Halobacteriovoraceae bacterium]
MKSDQQRAFLAVVISGIILFVWQFYVAPKKKPSNGTVVQNQTSAAPTAQPTNAQTVETTTKQEQTPTNVAKIENAPGETFIVSNSNYKFEITNYLTVTDAYEENTSAGKEVFESNKLLALNFLIDKQSQTIPFKVEKINEQSLSGTNEKYGISFKAHLKENGKFNFVFTKTENSPITSIHSVFSTTPKEKGRFSHRTYAYTGTDLNSVTVGKAEQENASIYWQGMDFDYHLFAIAFEKKSDAVIRSYGPDFGEYFESFVKFDENSKELNIVFLKKEYNSLTKLGNNLHLSVDLGMFSFLAVPILKGLQFFHTLIPNYGIAIILLTLIIRILVFPLQYKSTKSMKKMQLIQPELKKIQEKYKNEPQKLQKESMALFKRSGTHPLSGCFPLLLQMPVFFALYKVLYNAVELVGAPFYFWITDLSSKDPLYVLPVLMGFFMFLQQKMTPTPGTDPVQKKIFLFMPIIFGFIMKDLPSGLNLYILISTVFAILQQYFVLKRVKV